MIYNVGSGGGASSADKVNYDNTQSQLEATNVQLAIDEVNSNISRLTGKIAQVEINTQNGPWVDVDYPTGFTFDNCVVISAEIYDSSNNLWFTFPNFGSNTYKPQAIRRTTTNIGVFNNNWTSTMQKVRVTLMKIS